MTVETFDGDTVPINVETVTFAHPNRVGGSEVHFVSGEKLAIAMKVDEFIVQLANFSA